MKQGKYIRCNAWGLKSESKITFIEPFKGNFEKKAKKELKNYHDVDYKGEIYEPLRGNQAQRSSFMPDLVPGTYQILISSGKDKGLHYSDKVDSLFVRNERGLPATLDCSHELAEDLLKCVEVQDREVKVEEQKHLEAEDSNAHTTDTKETETEVTTDATKPAENDDIRAIMMHEQESHKAIKDELEPWVGKFAKWKIHQSLVPQLFPYAEDANISFGKGGTLTACILAKMHRLTLLPTTLLSKMKLHIGQDVDETKKIDDGACRAITRMCVLFYDAQAYEQKKNDVDVEFISINIKTTKRQNKDKNSKNDENESVDPKLLIELTDTMFKDGHSPTFASSLCPTQVISGSLQWDAFNTYLENVEPFTNVNKNPVCFENEDICEAVKKLVCMVWSRGIRRNFLQVQFCAFTRGLRKFLEMSYIFLHFLHFFLISTAGNTNT